MQYVYVYVYVYMYMYKHVYIYIYLDVYIYILTEGRNFKAFLKENYVLWCFGQLLLAYLKNVQQI